MRLTRREFIKKTGATIIGASLIGFENTLEKRKLGKTGLNITILGLGCAQIGSIRSFKQAVKIVETAIDLGINYIDTASTYGNSEEKVGEVMKSRRKEVILATKTLQRDKESSWREINTSLERLKTDYVDILQIHSVNTMYELDKITSPKSFKSLSTGLRGIRTVSKSNLFNASFITSGFLCPVIPICLQSTSSFALITA